MPLRDFIVGFMHAPAEFRQNHDFQIAVFQKQGMIRLFDFFIRNFFDNRMRIDHAATSLIDALFEKHRVFVRFADRIGRQRNIFFPGTHARKIFHVYTFLNVGAFN